ncbi:MAG: malectin domain-containing carbohydrate-binding protein [Acidobacteriota bacterium]|nr:malectin domain-containing carbohydrate-binding protein [Acidobacteriota bacterium]
MNIRRLLATALLSAALAAAFFPAPARAQETLSIADIGWRLWLDRDAAWKDDPLFLPGDADLKNCPLHIPTGGWSVLHRSAGIPVALPSTVEEHYWGETGRRPYRDEYWFERTDGDVLNGGYQGVSWWWKEITVPARFAGKIVHLRIRGARLRAEVFLNGKLVGYDILGETPFVCDIGGAILPGQKNLLAVRITNPGGRLDWADTKLLQWGAASFFAGHSFGGLDRGLTLTAHDPVYIEDAWALNTAQVRRIKASARLRNETEAPVRGDLVFEIIDPAQKGAVIASRSRKITIPAAGDLEASETIEAAQAGLWDLDSPQLYLLRTRIVCPASAGAVPSAAPPEAWRDEAETKFGFRWFEAEGIGTNAVLRLNGSRIRPVSAISWGYWGFNGLWPSPDLAEREVWSAKTLGLTMLHFHRAIGRAEVLDAQDRLGLLRIMEPGGGQTALGEAYPLYAKSPAGRIDASGAKGDASTFAERYMEEKILRMVLANRSRPSLVAYELQNEIHPDLRNPRIARLLRRVHAEDPSRIVLLKSGLPPANQAWMKPYDDAVLADGGDGVSGWRDEHTVGGPGVWTDSLYKGPDEFTHRSTVDKEIAAWGEMLGAGVPDNHAGIVREVKRRGGRSYDLEDHEDILTAYEKFLARWDFRDAYPTAEKLFLSIGDKSYDFWGRVIETARLAESNDLLVISGWESTSIENHSGLVDNLRRFKGNPQLMTRRLAPLRPVIKPRAAVAALGGRAVVDAYLLNETNAPAGARMTIWLEDPHYARTELGTYDIPAFRKDRFVYPVKAGIETPALEFEGVYRIFAAVEGMPAVAWTEEIPVVDPAGPAAPLPRTAAVTGGDPKVVASLQAKIPAVAFEAYNPARAYDLYIAGERLLYGWTSPDIDPAMEIEDTDDDQLFRSESWGDADNLEFVFDGLPKGQARITLRFAEVTLSGPGKRVFDVAVNGRTVLKDFDIAAAAGGVRKAIDRVFDIPAPDGVVRVTVPRRTVNYAKFSAIKVEAGGKVVAVNCGGKPYLDKTGLLWETYARPVALDDAVLARVRRGASLLVLPEGAEAVEAYARRLAEAGAFQFKAAVGEARASWMGSWCFSRKHPVLDGLPVDQAMKSDYQVPIDGTSGVVVEGRDVEIFIGYGRDHDRNIGAAGFAARLGQGRILFFGLPILAGLKDAGAGLQPVMAARLLENSLKVLAPRTSTAAAAKKNAL